MHTRIVLLPLPTVVLQSAFERFILCNRWLAPQPLGSVIKMVRLVKVAATQMAISRDPAANLVSGAAIGVICAPRPRSIAKMAIC